MYTSFISKVALQYMNYLLDLLHTSGTRWGVDEAVSESS